MFRDKYEFQVPNRDHFSKNVVQRSFKDDEGSEAVLKFNFVAVNLAKLLQAMRNGESRDFSKDLINELMGRDVTPSKIEQPESILQHQLKRRLALASHVVNQSQGDKTLGRTKLAKVIFLSDSLYKLDLGMKYERAAAGPLDMKAMVDPRIGLESLAEKNSFFKTIKSKKTEAGNSKYSYIPQRNIQKGEDFAKEVFVDSLEAINALIKLLRPLNTEQSEIVATLFCCWNDLAFGNQVFTDDDIIEDFLTNWHENKERFNEKRDVLKAWLGWMRRNNVIPPGDRTLSIKDAA